MAKFYTYYLERGWAYFLALVLSVLFLKCAPFESIHIDPLLYDKLVDFSGILFGFLITVLTILVQANNDAINLLKKHNRFKDLIFYNKEVITISALVCGYAVAILAFKDSFLVDYIPFLKKCCLTGLVFLISLMIMKTYQYLRIFYKVISSP